MDIPISKFRATCGSVLDTALRTGQSVVVTRFGRPIAGIVPISSVLEKSWLGCMRDSMEVSDDIVGPVGAFAE